MSMRSFLFSVFALMCFVFVNPAQCAEERVGNAEPSEGKPTKPLSDKDLTVNDGSFLENVKPEVKKVNEGIKEINGIIGKMQESFNKVRETVEKNNDIVSKAAERGQVAQKTLEDLKSQASKLPSAANPTNLISKTETEVKNALGYLSEVKRAQKKAEDVQKEMEKTSEATQKEFEKMREISNQFSDHRNVSPGDLKKATELSAQATTIVEEAKQQQSKLSELERKSQNAITETEVAMKKFDDAATQTDLLLNKIKESSKGIVANSGHGIVRTAWGSYTALLFIILLATVGV